MPTPGAEKDRQASMAHDRANAGGGGNAGGGRVTSAPVHNFASGQAMGTPSNGMGLNKDQFKAAALSTARGYGLGALPGYRGTAQSTANAMAFHNGLAKNLGASQPELDRALAQHAYSGMTPAQKASWQAGDFLLGPAFNMPGVNELGLLDDSLPGWSSGGTWHGTYNKAGMIGAGLGAALGLGIGAPFGPGIIGGMIGSKFGDETSWGNPGALGGFSGSTGPGPGPSMSGRAEGGTGMGGAPAGMAGQAPMVNTGQPPISNTGAPGFRPPSWTYPGKYMPVSGGLPYGVNLSGNRVPGSLLPR